MFTLKPVTQRDLAKLRGYYENCNYRLCEYSALVKLMWRGWLHPQYAEAAGCLIVRNTVEGVSGFEYPVPGAHGDENAALDAIEEYCMETGTPLRFTNVPREKGERFFARYPYLRFSKPRIWRDYLYAAENLRDFPGRHYSGQRNHVNKFRKLYPDARFRTLGKGDMALIEQFWQDYEAVFTKESKGARGELALAKKMLALAEKPYFCAGGMEDGGRLISLCLAERCGSTLVDHIEKALYGYEGVYPTTVQEFARHFAVDGIEWINREDDAGDKGLRTSKLQYLPTELGEELCFTVETELRDLDEIPTIRTQRLTLSALTEKDKAAYNALCLDDARNQWWGYDYRKDWKGEDLEDYFLTVAHSDFARKLAVNFAVRLDGKCIGEVLLYRFDGRGGAEEGCRIAPEYAGQGYGTEAFAALADWGLYKLGLSHIVAKCYHENESSYKMLSSCMRKSGADDTFCYFNKEV